MNLINRSHSTRMLRNTLFTQCLVFACAFASSPIFAGDCGIGQGFSIQERIDDCALSGDGTIIDNNGRVVGSVIQRTASKLIVLDVNTRTIWGALSPIKMRFRESKRYCKTVDDLGLRWRLPEIEEFRYAFYPENPDNYTHFHNNRFVRVLPDSVGNRLWTASMRYVDTAFVFDALEAIETSGYVRTPNVGPWSTSTYSARCVSQ